MWPTVRDYYTALCDEARKRIDTEPVESVTQRNADEWEQALVDELGLEPIEIDAKEAHLDPSGGRVGIPIRSGSASLETLIGQGLWGGNFRVNISISQFSVDPGEQVVYFNCGHDEHEIRGAAGNIRTEVRHWASALQEGETCLRQEIRQAIARRKAAVRAQQQRVESLAQKYNLRLRRPDVEADVMPTAVAVRRTITKKAAPAHPTPAKPAADAGQVPVLEPAALADITKLIDCQARQFERTPRVFSALCEEDLRDILLSSLNAVFEGDAGGEVFSVGGKCDILLRVATGALFIAECKFWKGPSSLREVTAQLRSRLSWRESHGTAIVLSRNADFQHVLSDMPTAIASCDGVVPKSIRAVPGAPSVFRARFTLSSDAGSEVDLEYRCHNLFTPGTAPSGATMTAAPKSAGGEP